MLSLVGHAHAQSYEIPCLIDVDHYAEQSRALADRHQGSHYDPVTNVVSWTSATLGQVTVRVGGCESFWLEASVTRKAPQLSSRATAISMIKRLVQAEWPTSPADDAARVLSSQPFEVRRWSKQSRAYFYKESGYGEVVLEHSFSTGMETVRFSMAMEP